jgi:hypothetical protein
MEFLLFQGFSVVGCSYMNKGKRVRGHGLDGTIITNRCDFSVLFYLKLDENQRGHAYLYPFTSGGPQY